MILLEDLSKQKERSSSRGQIDEEKVWTLPQTSQRLDTGEND
jgi:hypothetical protein